MNLTPVEWSKAQGLLIKLVQTLAPLTDGSIPSSFLNRRFFIPPANEGSLSVFKHPVRLLTTLHSVQKQVAELIGESPSQEKALSSTNPPQAKSEQKEAQRPFTPLAKQAKNLIDQVQEAIAKLTSSSYVKDPGEAPLRDTLRRLKPHLDRIIEALAQEGMDFNQERSPSPFRFSLPRSSREELVRKQIHSPMTEPLPKRDEEKRTEPLSRPREEKLQKRGEGTANSSNTPAESTSLSRAKPQQERGSLPAAPFVPNIKNLIPLRKKNKRKGFWFRNKKEEDPTDS